MLEELEGAIMLLVNAERLESINYAKQQIRDVVSSLLASEREKTLREVMEELPDELHGDWNEWYVWGWNVCLDFTRTRISKKIAADSKARI